MNDSNRNGIERVEYRYDQGHYCVLYRIPSATIMDVAIGARFMRCGLTLFGFMVGWSARGLVGIHDVQDHLPLSLSLDGSAHNLNFMTRASVVTPAVLLRTPADEELIRKQSAPAPKGVAACVGGLLDLRTNERGRGIAESVMKVLSADVFVAGTIKGEPTRANIDAALDGIHDLRPFARASVITMPTVSELASMLQASPNWRAMVAHTSSIQGRGCQKRDYSYVPLSKCLPVYTSPVLGNPNGNTLQELHYQDRCMRLIAQHETGSRAGRTYDRLVFTRLEFEWLASHPPLSLLDSRHLWMPTGEDNAGLNDRHWVANRHDGEIAFTRWRLLFNSSTFAAAFEPTQRNRGPNGSVFISSEVLMQLNLHRARVSVARFPAVAMLQCCANSYINAATPRSSTTATAAAKPAATTNAPARCFAQLCIEIPCPARPLPACTRQLALSTAQRVGQGTRAPGQRPVLTYKYDYEGRSAIFHATALSFLGARFVRATDEPLKLEISLPPGLGQSLARDAAARNTSASAALQSAADAKARSRTDGKDVERRGSRLYSCVGCDQGKHFGLLPSGCFTGRCLQYDDPAAIAAVCAMLPDAERRWEFRWWCSALEPVIAAARVVRPVGRAWSRSARRRRRGKPPSPVGKAVGFDYVGMGSVPEGSMPCSEASFLHRLPTAVGGMCQPGNLTVAECGSACQQLPECSSFVWMPRPSWSAVSECYLKAACAIDRLQALDGVDYAYTYDRKRCTRRIGEAWLNVYGDDGDTD